MPRQQTETTLHLGCREHIMKKCNGFTLVELLVVIAIIGILIALLLPAVQAAREAARRMSCTSNLKNIALAAQNYHDTYGRFPMGQVYETPQGDPLSGWGWGAGLLPFIEQGSLGKMIDFDLTWDAPVNAAALETSLPIFNCPSSIKPDNQPHDDLNPGTSSYVGVSGAFKLSQQTTRKLESMGYSARKIQNGTFFRNSEVKMSQASDGTSNTFIVGEALWFDFDWDPLWVGHAKKKKGAYIAGTTLALVRHAEYPMNLEVTQGNADPQDVFGSYHSGGANFAAMDGSVHFISESIEQNSCSPDDWIAGSSTLSVYQRLCSRNDGLVASIP